VAPCCSFPLWGERDWGSEKKKSGGRRELKIASQTGRVGLHNKSFRNLMAGENTVKQGGGKGETGKWMSRNKKRFWGCLRGRSVYAYPLMWRRRMKLMGEGRRGKGRPSKSLLLGWRTQVGAKKL